MPAAKSIICIETGIIYESIHGAEKLLGKRLNIQAVLSSKRETAGGYHWRYTTEDDFKPVPLGGLTGIARNSKCIKCVETGEIFRSACEAARKTNIDQGHLTLCLNGKRKICCFITEEIMKEELQEICGMIENILRENKFSYPDEEALIIADKILNLGYHKTVWHKVADGDLPKEKQNVLIAFKGFQTNKIVIISGFYLKGDFMNENSSKIRKDHVIAWTELFEYKE